MRYQIRIYDRSLPYDDEIYRTEDNNDKIEVMRGVKTIGKLLEVWEELYEEYEGSTYCIRDMFCKSNIIGGIFDSFDYDYIERYAKAFIVYGKNISNEADIIKIETFETKELAERFCEQWGWIYDDGKHSYYMEYSDEM